MSFPENKPQKQTYWFYKWPLWLRIVLCIFLSPIFIPIVIWPIIKLPIWGKILLLVGWIIVMLVISGSSNSSESSKNILLNVSGISEGEIKKDDKVSFKVKTDPLTVDEVTINGESATKKGWDSEYSLDKTFPEGDNLVKIVAKKDGKIAEKEFNFKVDLSERKAVEEVRQVEELKIKEKNKDSATEYSKNISAEFGNNTIVINNKNDQPFRLSNANIELIDDKNTVSNFSYPEGPYLDAFRKQDVTKFRVNPLSVGIPLVLNYTNFTEGKYFYVPKDNVKSVSIVGIFEDSKDTSNKVEFTATFYND